MHFTHTKKSLGFAILEIKLTCCNSLSLLEFRNRQLRIRINSTGWNIHGYIGTVERKCRGLKQSNCILCQLTISNFNEEAVDFLMESKDLQIFLEDEELSRYASLNSILCVPFPKIFYCCIFSFYFASLLECVVSCVCSGGDVATQKESII